MASLERFMGLLYLLPEFAMSKILQAKVTNNQAKIVSHKFGRPNIVLLINSVANQTSDTNLACPSLSSGQSVSCSLEPTNIHTHAHTVDLLYYIFISSLFNYLHKKV